MANFEDWQKYLDEQTQEVHRRRKALQITPDEEPPKTDKVLQDVRSMLLGGEKEPKPEDAKAKQSTESGAELKIDESTLEKTPFPFRFANPSSIILQKDKSNVQASERGKREEKIASIEDPVTLLTQKDKKSHGGHKKENAAPTILESLYPTRQIELPLEGLPPEKESKLHNFMEKRERLLRNLLDPKITLTEGAMILAVPKETVLQFVDEKLIPCHRMVGGHLYFNLSDVLAFLEQRQDILKVHPHEVEKILTEQEEFDFGGR